MPDVKLDIEIRQPDRESAIATLLMLAEELKDNPDYFAGFGEHLHGDFAFTLNERDDDEEEDEEDDE